jgi:hypothetical protein
LSRLFIETGHPKSESLADRNRIGFPSETVWDSYHLPRCIQSASLKSPCPARAQYWSANRFFGAVNYRICTSLVQELLRLASQKLGIDELTSSTGMRVAYVQLLGEGLTVTELADTSARDEGKALTTEVKNLLKV